MIQFIGLLNNMFLNDEDIIQFISETLQLKKEIFPKVEELLSYEKIKC
jgi:hypothetical protein